MALRPHLSFSAPGAVFFLRLLGPTSFSRPLYPVCRLTVSSSGDRLIDTDVKELGSDVFVRDPLFGLEVVDDVVNRGW